MQQIHKTLFYFCSLLFLACSALADNIPTTPAGGINFTKPAAISIEREELTISATHVKTAYLFKNNSDSDVTTQILFMVPEYKTTQGNQIWDTEIPGANADAPFTNFALTVQGQPQKFNAVARAVMNGQDITQQLTAANIPLNPDLASGTIANTDPAKLTQWQQQTKQLNLVDETGKPKWQKQIIFYWTQTFPANQAVLIETQYKPAAGILNVAADPNKGSEGLQSETMQNIKTIFNFDFANPKDEDNLRTWLAQQIQNNSPVTIYNIAYNLAADATAEPIKNFTLTIVKPSISAVAYNRFYNKNPGQRVDGLSNLTIFMENFVPKSDLQVLFAVPTAK